MQLDDALETFIVESTELLEAMESTLLALRLDAVDAEDINAIFRAAHTIKGSAGLFGLDGVVAFTHVLESVLDRVRDGELSLVEDLRTLLLSCRDHIGALIRAVAAGHQEEDAELTRLGAPLIDQLQAHLNSTAGAAVGAAGAGTPSSAPPDSGSRGVESGGRWHISVRFGADVLRNGMDPLSFVRYLGTVGTLVKVELVADALPALDQLDAESCHLGLELALESTAGRNTIEQAFEFVADDASVVVLSDTDAPGAFVDLMESRPEGRVRMRSLLLSCGSVSAEALDSVHALDPLHVPDTADAEALVDAGRTVDQGLLAASPGHPDPAATSAGAARANETQASIRVDSAKLDQLINRVGELIIAAASTTLAARRAGLPELHDCASVLSALVEEVRDGALELRMVRIGATFGRFQRLVRDLSRELGKDIRLVIRGEDTELDKTLVERIGDPLTHLVRNAMDHGIATPEYRLARGKSAHGTITLNAYHDSGSVVIEVSDDGRGLNRERILAKAVERGLVEADRQMSDSEVFALIFEPGFSTAEQVTNLSGRGVGMDVVKRNITALRGSVEVSSVAGVGTTVRIRLPLTLAIIDGFLVGLGRAVFVVPLDMIDECLEYPDDHDQDFINLRGQVLPFIRLRALFDVEGEASGRQSIVVVRHAGVRVGLVVDALHGEFQTVIKPLGRMFRKVECISGSTILGNGEVGLIVDVPALMRNAVRSDAERMHGGGIEAEVPAA